MTETVRDSRLVWGVAALGSLLIASLLWTWSIGNNLSALDQRGKQFEARLADAEATDAIAALEKRQADLEAAIAALEVPDLGPMQRQVADLKSELANLQTKVADFTVPGLDDLVLRVSAVEALMDSLELPDLAPVQARMADLQIQVQGLQGQIGDFAPGRVDALDTRLSSVETTVTEIASTGPEGLQGRFDALAVRLAGISIPDIGPVESQLEAATTDIATLKTSVAAAATRDQVGALEARFSTLGAQINESGAGLAGVLAETAKLSSQLTELRATLATRADSAEVASLASQLDALTRQVATLATTDTSTFQADASTLRSDLEALATRVAELPSAAEIAALRTDLSKLVDNPPSARPPQLMERIYFGSSGTSVTADERSKIAAIAQELITAPTALEIVGFSDSQGPAEFNRNLSLRRAAAVRLALLEAGVDPAAVTAVAGLGEDAPPVDVGDDADEASNRVVLIYGRR